jgi:hypothetical protein
VNRGKKIGTLMKVEHHTFRKRKLCSSPSYQTAMAAAQGDFDTSPSYTSREVMDAFMTGTRLLGTLNAFFYEPLPALPSDGTHNNGRGGGSNFAHHNRRYRQGWDAGKPEDEDS